MLYFETTVCVSIDVGSDLSISELAHQVTALCVDNKLK